MADRKIDPRIYFPPVEGLQSKNTERVDVPSSDQEFSYVTNPEPGLQPPENFRVVESIYRKSSDGRTVVDLVIEVEEVPGATEYDVRSAVA